MRPLHRFRTVTIGLSAATLLSAACGQWQAPAPTGPSRVPGPAAIPSMPAAGTGTISGSVNGTSRAQGWTATGSSTSTNLTVTIVETNVSTTVDFFGRFVFESVPTASVHLRFSGPGINATLNVGVVRERERIDLNLTVNATAVTIESSIRIEADDSTEIDGPVTTVSGTCPNLVVGIHGMTVNLSSSTPVSCESMRVGVRIRISGRHHSTSVVVAVRVVVVTRPPNRPPAPGNDDDDDDDDDDSDD